MNLTIACLDREHPANDRVFQLLVEEYKSLREEIGRFQNQQKQLIAAAIAGLAAVGAGLLSQSQSTIVRYPELLLLGPLFFGTLSLLFFEAESAVIRAGYYSGVVLRLRAQTLCVGANEPVLAWESFRATHEGKLSRDSKPSYLHFSCPKLLLFEVPSLLCLAAFYPYSTNSGMPPDRWDLGLLLLDGLIVLLSLERFKKALDDVKTLNAHALAAYVQFDKRASSGNESTT